MWAIRWTVGDVKIHVVPADAQQRTKRTSGRLRPQFADGRTLYHEGDTWVFGDMSLIQEFYHPNIILMGCGAVADGQYARMALACCESLLQAEIVIPMHYGALHRIVVHRVTFAPW